jgi:peptidoglycan/xylan/chitin deacetylase (PgdA/CDA1 family)
MIEYTSRLSDDRFVIFLLHGVISENTYSVRNYTHKHLELDYFVGFLKSIQDAGGQPISMTQIAESHLTGEKLPDKSFAITFDDGFLNNLTVAAPVLEELSIPATFYLTSDFIDSNRMSWIDRIEWALEETRQGKLDLPWETGCEFESQDEKIDLLDEIRANVKVNAALSGDDIASGIQEQLGLPQTSETDDQLDKKMNWTQVRKLASSPIFDVGGHTHTHAILALLPTEEMEQEIDLSIKLLQEKTGIVSRHYSYPEGMAHCYSPSVIETLKKRNIDICPTAIDGDNDIKTDLFHLRRVMVV